MFSSFGFFLPQFHLTLAAAPDKMHFSSFYSINNGGLFIFVFKSFVYNQY